MKASRTAVLRYRMRVSHLDVRLPAGQFARAAWGGLQDSVPRGGVIALHARVEGTKPDSWEDPSIVQIWFRGGADYIVPRDDAGVFTLGSYPRDPEEGRRLERLADDIHRAVDGRVLKVSEVDELLGFDHPTQVRAVALTGRAHIRWDASNIWLIPVPRPDLDVEDARRELARRFVHWYGPTTAKALKQWTGVQPRDAKATWTAIEPELSPVDLDGQERFMLRSDLDALAADEAVAGVRLVPFDDPYTKLDKELLVVDEAHRMRVIPPAGTSLGYIPGAVIVDGDIVGAWGRQGRKVTIYPLTRLSAAVREAIERDALAFPIATTAPITVAWDDPV